MANLTIDLIRPDDLLALRVELVNLELDPSRSGRLRRVSSDEDALLVVQFPPQHVVENKNSGVAGTRPEGFISGPSRLTLRLREDEDSISLDVPTLLSWGDDATGPLELVDVSLELPFRLLTRPIPLGQWTHRTVPFTSSGWAELWHTRLVGPSTIEVLDSPDRNDPLDGPGSPALPLGSAERVAIVEAGHRFALERLFLSALGAWLKIDAKFDNPRLLSEWKHIVSMGRDQYVRAEKPGTLFPYRFRASMTEIVKREFTSPPDVLAGLAFPGKILTVRDQESVFSSREFPFRAIRVGRMETEGLRVDEPGDSGLVKRGDEDFLLPVIGVDIDGRHTEFATPVVFIADGGPLSPDDAAAKYGERRVEIRDQRIAFAPPGAVKDSTTLTTRALHIAAPKESDFLPALIRAEVSLPASERFGGGLQRATIHYHSSYLETEFEGSRDGVFAIVEPHVPVQLPAATSGGLASPQFAIGGLSREFGAVPSVSSSGGGLDGGAVTGLDGQLIGTISLKDIIKDASNPDQLPRLRTFSGADGRSHAQFEWHPEVKKLDGGQGGDLSCLRFTDKTTLAIKGDFSGLPPDSGASTEMLSDVSGTLKTFTLSFVDCIDLRFDELTFRTVTGRQPEFTAKVKFEFGSKLDFLKPLVAVMDSFGPQSGPSLKVTADGVSAGLTLALPAFAMGAFSLQNVALSAGVKLYFANNPAEIRFALSSPDNPFLVSVWLFGGGGYFGLTANTRGLLKVEAKLEFGGVVALNLVVAKGVVQLMAGIYFAIVFEHGVEKSTEIGGYVRLVGCLEVLGIVAIAVDFSMKLTIEGSKAKGEATLTVSVRVFAFSQSVSLTVQRQFSSTAEDPSFEEMVLLPEWQTYCDAFA